jgi:hypothetical protein
MMFMLRCRYEIWSSESGRQNLGIIVMRIRVFWDTESCLNKLGKNHPIALNPLTNLSIPTIAVSGCNAP